MLAGREIILQVHNLKKAVKINDAHLDYNQAMSMAFASLVDSKLVFALEYEMVWIHTVLQQETEGSDMPWPLDSLVPWQTRERRKLVMLAKRPVLKVDEIYAQAKTALDSIIVQLGLNSYMFGEKFVCFNAGLRIVIAACMLYCILLSTTWQKVRKKAS